MYDTRTGPVRGLTPGVAAIDYDGARYCLDCAAIVLDGRTIDAETEDGWTTFKDVDGADFVRKMVSGEVYTLGYGGVCLRHGGDGEDYYCERGEHCVNALSPDEHPFDHDKRVGVLLDY
jgi:hypothetical protein